MPDFSKMFAKRLEEDNYKNLVSFLTGKATYGDLPAVGRGTGGKSFVRFSPLF